MFPQKRAQQATSSSNNPKPDRNDVIEGVAEEVGEWVEYVDSFGRTRRCPKEDLPDIMTGNHQQNRRRERFDIYTHAHKIILLKKILLKFFLLDIKNFMVWWVF